MRRGRKVSLGLAMLIIGEVGAWASGNALSLGYWAPQFLPAWMAAAPYDKSITLITGPFLLLADRWTRAAVKTETSASAVPISA